MRKKSIYNWERRFCKDATSMGYHVERVAASGRREDSVCDVVLIKEGITWLTEIKTISSKYLYLKEEQMKRLLETCQRIKVNAMLVVWFKNKSKGWHFIELKDKIPKKVVWGQTDVHATY